MVGGGGRGITNVYTPDTTLPLTHTGLASPQQNSSKLPRYLTSKLRNRPSRVSPYTLQVVVTPPPSPVDSDASTPPDPSFLSAAAGAPTKTNKPPATAAGTRKRRTASTRPRKPRAASQRSGSRQPDGPVFVSVGDRIQVWWESEGS